MFLSHGLNLAYKVPEDGAEPLILWPVPLCLEEELQNFRAVSSIIERHSRQFFRKRLQSRRTDMVDTLIETAATVKENV